MTTDPDAREIIDSTQTGVDFIYRQYGADVSPEHAAIIAQNQIAQSNLAIAAAILELAEAVRGR